MIGIRPYRTDDAGALAAIFHDAVQVGSAGVYDQVQRDDWSPSCPSAEAWRARLDGLTTMVAEAGGVPIGFVSMDMASGLFDLAFVRSDRARLGVGGRLYAAIMAEARARGLAAFTVETSPLSEPFFRARGWRQTGTRTRGEGAGRVTTVLLALDDR